MAVTLPETQQIVERSFFMTLLAKVQEFGYIPDKTDTVAYPPTIVGENAYRAAINSIITTKGYAIRVVGSGTTVNVGIKDLPVFVIGSSSYMLGDLGGDLNYHHEYFEQSSNYKKKLLPPQSVDFYLDVHIVCNSIGQYRTMASILALALPMRYYLPSYNAEDKRFLITINQGAIDVSDKNKGILEYIYKYKAHDLYVQPDIYSDDAIEPVNEITVETKVNDMDDKTTQVIN